MIELNSDIRVECALLGPEYEVSSPVRIEVRDGLIQTIMPDDPRPGRRLLAMPALTDAHNHARPLSTTSFGCAGKPLELWLPQLASMPSVDAYTACAASFARSLQGGCAAVMVHLTRPMGLVPLAEEARQIARAARDVGVSIGLAISMRDRNPLVYGDHQALIDGLDPDARAFVERTWLKPLPSIETQLARVDAVADAVADLPGHVDVQYGPTGVQWCSDALLQAIAEASKQSGRRIHMHLLETKPQREWADRTYKDGMVEMLDRIGFLSKRLTLAHGVWARPAELDIIAASGARIAVNVSSNLHLLSGIASVPSMLQAGIDVAMGLDGCAFDEDDDGLRELRLFHLINHSPAFDQGGLTHQSALKAACATGRAGLGLPEGGILDAGMPADIMLLDLETLDRDQLMPVSPKDYLFARATKAHIADVFAGGRHVLKNGVLQGVDLAKLETALRAQYRDGLRSMGPFNASWPSIEKAIGAHYLGCC